MQPTIRACLVSVAVTAAPASGQSCPFGGLPEYDVVPLTGLENRPYRVAALNGVGAVAGLVFAEGSSPAHAFVWQDGSLAFHALPGPSGSVADVNDDGVVVGIAGFTTGEPELFVWSSATDDFEIVPTATPVFPNALNDDLRVVGLDADGLFGFALDAATRALHPIAFGGLPREGVGTLGALGVNAGGLVVGAEVIFLDELGFYQETPYAWTDTGGITALPTLDPGFGGRAVDVNDAGDIAGIVHDAFSGKQTALWTDGGQKLHNLGSPFGFFVSEATAINASRQITVVAPNDLFGYTRGFLWEGGGFLDLSCFLPAGLFVLRPVDINDAGEILVQVGDIVGLTILDNFVLRPVPRDPTLPSTPSTPDRRPTDPTGPDIGVDHP